MMPPGTGAVSCSRSSRPIAPSWRQSAAASASASSAARDDFDPGRSDIDFLVAFDSAAPGPSLDRYFGYPA
jgi:predicted nucleotidyltransferase